MPLVDLATAKAHLRVTDSSEDANVLRMVAAAERMAQAFLGRNVYADEAARDAAIAAAPAAAAAAAQAYDDAMTASRDLPTRMERELACDDARATRRAAEQAYRMARNGMVLHEGITTAILLIAASLWEHRGDEDAIVGIPPAAQAFLGPDRVGLGV